MKLIARLLHTVSLKTFLKLCPLLFYRFHLVLVKNPSPADIQTVGYWEKLMNGEPQEAVKMNKYYYKYYHHHLAKQFHKVTFAIKLRVGLVFFFNHFRESYLK